MPPRLALAALLALVFPPLTLAQGGLSPPDAATPSGDTIREIYWVVLGACIVVFLLIETALVLFIVRYRGRPGTREDVEGPQVHGNTRLELAWTIAPALALLAIAIYTFVRVPAVEATPGGAEAESALTVRVQSHQFYWQYVYPNGAITFDTLYLPVDRTVTLELTALDVEHSWWVPELTGKRDAIPGTVNPLSFKPTRTGTFRNGKCAEFCGIQHAVMATTVEVVSQQEFERVLDERAPEDADLVAFGKEEWEAACAKCHGLDGEGDIGPVIAGNTTLVNREALRQLLLEGQDTPNYESYMPPVGRAWTPRQYDALIAYVKSNPKLSGEEGEEDADAATG